jgi:hypothetical protein
MITCTRGAAITITVIFGVIAACLIAFFLTDKEVSKDSVKSVESAHDGHCGPACGHGQSAQSARQRVDKTPAEAEAIRAAKSQARAFSGWAHQQTIPSNADEQALSEGLALAKLRRTAMKLLIQQDPDTALEQALGYAEYAALPAEIQVLVEKPFSTTGHLEVQIACGDGISQFHHILEIGEDGYLELSMPEDHRTELTKSNLPVQGIELGKQAVVRGQTFQALEDVDAAYVAQEWPAGQADPSHCFLSGEPIQGEGVTAVAGGMVFQFQDLQSLQHIESLMAEADAKLGMNNGSSWLIVAAAGGELEQFPEPQFNEEVVEANYNSAIGAKTAFFILVDFPDASGDPDPSNLLESNIDTIVDDGLRRYSFNQTSMESTVYSSTIFRMPSNTTAYTSGTNYNQLYSDALAAYIDSGGANRADPSSTYDTVGLLCVNAGFGWAGLASVGGQRMWLDGTTNNEVILHEFGHNYGLSHAEYWVFDNSNGSSTDPVDPAGASQSYGDSYDVMGGGNVTDGHFNPGPKAFLNWIPSNDWEDLTGSVDNDTYRIYRFDHESSTGRRALRVAKIATSDHYWVGFRKDYSELDDFANGASLTWEKGNGNPSRNQT